tara:strand:- start:2260 stop:2658 length:399 start_codon:yes stop_codon:yes gene_type:complete
MNKQQQRVNIQYSVNLEEVPSVLLKLATGAIKKLSTVATTSGHVVGELTEHTYDNPQEAARQIDNIRRALADIDYRLSECQSMYTSLSQLDESGHPPQNPTEQLDTTAATEALREMMASQVPSVADQGTTDE